MDYNNALILSGKISEIGEALTSNIKDSYRMGIELTGGVSITHWLDWNGNVTLSRNKIKDYTILWTIMITVARLANTWEQQI